MPETKRTLKGVLGGLLGLVGLSAVAGVLVTASVTPAIAMAGFSGSQALTLFEELPSYLKIGAPMEPTTIYGTGTDGNPVQLAKFYDQNRVPVTFDQVSPVLYDAILSSEDKSFYEHGGVNLGATIKAVVDNLRKTSSRGASTISQQFVKNVLIQECEKNASPSEEGYLDELRACWTEATQATGAAGIERKLQEMRYAIQIEKDYSKNDILLGYLNIANFGGQTYGIEAAANYYFNTTSANLTVSQAATLAGIVQNPNRYRIDMPGGSTTDADGNPLNGAHDGYKETKDRRDYVLGRMHTDGKITDEQYEQALAEPITPVITPTQQGCGAAGDNAYFCQYVKAVIENDEAFGETLEERREKLSRGGMEIYTSLDMRVQQPAIDAMNEWVPESDPNMALGASAVSLEADTGRVLSIVQNTRFSESAGDAGTPGVSSLVFAADKRLGGGSGFQVGSTYKLFTLLKWLEDGHSINETLNGVNRTFREFTSCGRPYNNNSFIGNYEQNRGYTGSVRRFTEQSLNSGFLAMAQELDLCEINKVAERLGVYQGDLTPVTEKNDPYGAVLGSKNIAPLQMAGAFAAVANKGIFCQPRVIDKIIAQDGTELPVPQSNCTQAIQPEIAATAAFALQGVMTNGTGRASNPFDGTPVLGKTGTHEDYSTMMVESSTKVTTAVWVGDYKGENGSLYDKWWNGVRYSDLRHEIAPVMQHAANEVYGGEEFPRPDQNLTRPVMKELPNVVGMPVDQATQTLEEAGFQVSVGAPVDSTVGAGLVAAQDPAAGQAAAGTTVTISPSSGKAPAAPVPNVVGSKLKQAEKALTDAGYGVTSDGCGNDDAVVAQNPAAGAAVPPGTSVALQCGDDD
ncbi:MULTISPECIES: transglycosylase domain-containing protein [Microbacterium]|uniref:transglycosylase domain-containing protein n=1 Tax=Microbacterium TaxID=33882 RepID=UPI00217DAC15|nr:MULTISPECIES: transglycosylase domain-containing protein [Microbacterium]UWF77101.1 transglycosylase domain-containing protein [Microbacterium neungamense]WCM55261.1 transglycosylase domain-containing protein [Microbacterium sp. EF45047]